MPLAAKGEEGEGIERSRKKPAAKPESEVKPLCDFAVQQCPRFNL